MRSIVVLISLFLLFSQSASQEWRLKDVFGNLGGSLLNKIKNGLNFQDTRPIHSVAEFDSSVSAPPSGKARIGEIRHVTVTPDSRTTTDLPRNAFRSKYGYRHRVVFRHNGSKPTSAELSFGAPFAGKTKAGRARHVTVTLESQATTEKNRNVFERNYGYGHTQAFRNKPTSAAVGYGEIAQFQADLARQKMKRVRNQVWDSVISRIREYPTAQPYDSYEGPIVRPAVYTAEERRIREYPTAPPYDSYEGPIVRPAVYTAEERMQYFQTQNQPKETLQGLRDWLAESRWLLVGAATVLLLVLFTCYSFYRRNDSTKQNDAVALLTDTSDGFPYISPDDHPYEELSDDHFYEIPRRIQTKETLILP